MKLKSTFLRKRGFTFWGSDNRKAFLQNVNCSKQQKGYSESLLLAAWLEFQST